MSGGYLLGPQGTWHDLLLDDGRVRYHDIGRGPIVLFVQGWTMSGRLYLPLLRALAEQGFRVLTPMQPGHGRTSRFDARLEPSLESLAEWNWHFVDNCANGTVIGIVGHSLGGPIALHMADQRPESTAGTVLLHTLGAPEWQQRDDFQTRRPLRHWASAVLREAMQFDGELILRMWSDHLSNMGRNPHGMWRLAHLARSVDLMTVAASVRGHQVSVRTVWGRNDRIATAVSGRLLSDALGADHLEFEGNHVDTLIRRPRELSECIGELLVDARIPQTQLT